MGDRKKHAAANTEDPFYPEEIILLKRKPGRDGSREGICRTKGEGFRPITIHPDGRRSVTMSLRSLSPEHVHRRMMDDAYEVLTYDIFGKISDDK